MKIENPQALKNAGYLRIYDLDNGECFAFLDDDTLYMKVDDDEHFIDVGSGEIIDIDDGRGNNYEDRPVKRVNVKVVIL